MHTPLLIENGTLLTLGEKPAVLANHSVLVENGWITRIAPKGRIRSFTGKRLDATGKLVLPGFINAHTHLYSTFARGLTRTRPANDFVHVLKNLWWRLDSALTVEDCYYSALISLIESIRHGTTTVIDHHASPGAVLGSLNTIERAVRETGLRACLCYELSDRDGSLIANQGLSENYSFIRLRKSRASGVEGAEEQAPAAPDTRPNPTLAALFGLHAAFTLKDSTLARAAFFGTQLQTGFHIHVAEAKSDQSFSRAHHGRTVVERLAKFGILGPQTIAAHCVHVSRKEIGILAETGTMVVHNPQSNMNNAVGIADVIGLSRRGVLVGLGTDAMTTNMLEELRVALWAQHLASSNPSSGFSETTAALFRNNSKIAQRIFQFPLGKLREGFAADIVLLDYDPPTPLTRDNCLGHLVFGASQAAVDTTIVGGRILMEQKRLTLGIDEAQANARARELAQKLWKRL
jgi:putative selenium metabolism protein SsnA